MTNASSIPVVGRMAETAARIGALRRIFEQGHVAGLRGAFNRRPLAALRAQGLDHRVDVAVGHAGRRLADFELADIDRADFRQHFELGRVFDLAVGRLARRVDLGRHGWAQIFLADRFVEAVTDQFRDRFAAHLRTETLFDHLGRNLAGTKTLQADAARDFGETSLDLRFILLCGNAHGELALEFAQVFDGNLHSRHLNSELKIISRAHREQARQQKINRLIAYAITTAQVVRMERLELSRVAPLAPKASASTNSATFAVIYTFTNPAFYKGRQTS